MDGVSGPGTALFPKQDVEVASEAICGQIYLEYAIVDI